MSLSVAFRFVAGRYHATPFGHHVNEGLIEWPPSPWRLVRALISVGYTSGVWDHTGLPSVARGLLERLCSELPDFVLPPLTGTHSRHYMPLGALDSKTKRERTTLVFDTWARVEDQELIATWANVSLGTAELCLLRTLVERLNYLGRSESWVQGRIVAEDESIPKINCFPEDAGEAPGRRWDQVALLVPDSASAYESWRARRLERELAQLPLPEGGKPSKTLLAKREKAARPYPDDLLDCLQRDTDWLRSHGWNRPPGSRRVLYWRPSDAIHVGAPRARSTARSSLRVKTMLLSLTNAGGNDHALPPVTRTLPQAELLHRAVIGIAAKRGTPPLELTGNDQHGRPLGGPHEHAHINPLDLDGDGHLDHILVWAPGGIGARAQEAIRAARKTFTKGGIEPLRLALAAVGDAPDLTRLAGEYGKQLAGLVDCAAEWQSITPFVPPRYVKTRGRNTLEGQIRAEFRSRGLPEPVTVERIVPAPVKPGDAKPTGGTVARQAPALWQRFRHFRLVRQRGPQPPVAYGFTIRIAFAEAVPGPLAIGYGSHFGLGLFQSSDT